ncbi:HD-GYP domain-containing protein [Pseudodesulfovibrio profundus]|uniref:HD-GYP domain-containing protein n=1 Tax=Pseudodesulfovibrio profundus TaxID=57320 RepID=UPI001E648FAC|nr:HD domain-containing phosphohydrolase [Pseudodesulfovibrio profundus]
MTKKTRLPKRRLDVLRARFQLHAQVMDFDWHDAYETIQAVNSSMTPSTEELEKVKKISQIRWQLGDDRPPLLYDDELEALMLEYGNLTSEERDEIERHPAESERILQHIPLQEGYDNLLTIIRQHHERMDGSGYPDGLLGTELLLQSRLMAIVDIYDAITQERHYKPARTRSEALKILSKERDRGKLDSDLVDFFLTNVDTIEMLSERVRSTRVTHLSEIGNLSTL